MTSPCEDRWLHRLPKVPTVNRVAWLCSLARGRRVIHIGFSDSESCRAFLQPRGLWLHSELARVARELVGIDIDGRSVEWVKKHGYDAVAADCCDVRAVEALQIPPAEVVIAGEVIEHVQSPGALLDSLHVLVAPHGYLVVTTPNAHSLVNTLMTVLRREAINPDHVALYSWYTLSNVLRQHGWRVRSFATYRYPLPGTLQGKLAFGLERLAARWSPFLAHGLIAVCESG